MPDNMEAIRTALVERGMELLHGAYSPEPFTKDPEVNAFVNDLAGHPHAFVIGCLMDRQQRSEKCWTIPFTVKQKVGSFEIQRLARLTADEVETIFIGPPGAAQAGRDHGEGLPRRRPEDR